MNLYRIYTEDKNEESLAHLAQSWHLDGYTILKGTGVFKGQQENSLILEIIGEPSLIEQFVFSLAKDIRLVNRQESVYVTSQPITLTIFE